MEKNDDEKQSPLLVNAKLVSDATMIPIDLAIDSSDSGNWSHLIGSSKAIVLTWSRINVRLDNDGNRNNATNISPKRINIVNSLDNSIQKKMSRNQSIGQLQRRNLLLNNGTSLLDKYRVGYENLQIKEKGYICRKFE
jgi:hypothetical protein